MTSFSPATSVSLFDIKSSLTERHLLVLNKVWNHYLQSGLAISARTLEHSFGRVDVGEFFHGVSGDLIYDSTSQGNRFFHLTALGALVCEDGDLILNRYRTLLELVISAYEKNPEVDRLPSSDIAKALNLDSSKMEGPLFRFLKLNTSYIGPLYVSEQTQNGEWALRITEDVVNLFAASDIDDYMLNLLLTSYSSDKPWKEADRSQYLARNSYTASDLFGLNMQQMQPSPVQWERKRDFVAQKRIDDLRASSHPSFDTARLIMMCEELAACGSSEHIHATAMLSRAILDHVPPIFGLSSFSEVANQANLGRSKKAVFRQLEETAKNVANILLHEQIGKALSIPTATQVDFSHGIDVLLAEVANRLQSND